MEGKPNYETASRSELMVAGWRSLIDEGGNPGISDTFHHSPIAYLFSPVSSPI
jgi:hypothetical protein